MKVISFSTISKRNVKKPISKKATSPSKSSTQLLSEAFKSLSKIK
jgi:hypothetical protein